MKNFFVCVPTDICDPKDVRVYFANNIEEVNDSITQFESQEDCFKEFVHDFDSLDGFNNNLFYVLGNYLFDVSKDEKTIKDFYLTNVNQFFKHSPYLEIEYLKCRETEATMSDELLFYIRKHHKGWSTWDIKEYAVPLV